MPDTPPVVIQIPPGTVLHPTVPGSPPIVPKPGLLSGVNELYQILLALFLLWLAMKYIPGGIYLGWIILAGVVLSTPDAVQAFSNLVQFIERGFQ